MGRRSQRDWLKIRGFGVEPDSIVARRVGCPPSTVRDARRRLGMECPREKIDWTRADWTQNDREIAKAVGASKSAVMRQRLARGIYRDGDTDCRRSKVWDAETLLGKVPDSVIAAVRRRSRNTVAAARLRRDHFAPTFTSVTVPLTEPIVAMLQKRYPRIDLHVAAWLELARSLGVHTDATAAYDDR